MEGKELTLYRDEHQSHEVVEWPFERLTEKFAEYHELRIRKELTPRQREEVVRLYARLSFEVLQRHEDFKKQYEILEELSR